MKVIERLQVLDFNFTGIANQEIEKSISIDKNYNKIIGIGVTADYFRDPSVIELFSFDNRTDIFPKGLMTGYFQSLTTEYVPVEIGNMELRTVTAKLRDIVGLPRRVQIVLYLEK